MYTLETRDFNNKQYIIEDYDGIKYSNHYSPKGSGFGYLSFTLKRKRLESYYDVNFGFKISLWKGIKKCLFSGWIVKINENSNGDYEIYALGSSTIYSFDIYNFILADNRIDRWAGGCTPSGSFRPDKFDVTNSWDVGETSFSGLQFTPRRGVDYNFDDYIYSRYRFNNGENVKRIKFNWSSQFPNGWPGQVLILDGNEDVIFSTSTSGNGVEDINISSDTNFVEIRLKLTTSGENTAEEDTVYFRVWNLTVYSTQNVVNAAEVCRYASFYMYVNYGFSIDRTLIEDVGIELLQAAYDEDKRLDEVITDACGYGSEDVDSLIWGTTFDDTNRLFLTLKNTDRASGYRIEDSEYEIEGDLTTSYQKVYGKYRDFYGIDQKTAVASDSDEIDNLGGLYRKEIIDLGESTEAQANNAIQLALKVSSSPKVSTDIKIEHGIYTLNNTYVPFDEILSGLFVEIPNFKSRSTRNLQNEKDFTYQFLLAKVEIDLDKATASLTPADNVTSFDNYMKKITEINK